MEGQTKMLAMCGSLKKRGGGDEIWDAAPTGRHDSQDNKDEDGMGTEQYKTVTDSLQGPNA